MCVAWYLHWSETEKDVWGNKWGRELGFEVPKHAVGVDWKCNKKWDQRPEDRGWYAYYTMCCLENVIWKCVH